MSCGFPFLVVESSFQFVDSGLSLAGNLGLFLRRALGVSRFLRLFRDSQVFVWQLPTGKDVLNGLVVMTAINQRIEAGLSVAQSIVEGSLERFRAVLMTGIVPAIGFVPMALATGTGAEVQKPLAIVVIGGLITSTLLTLFVLPAISHLLLRGRRDGAGAGDRPLDPDAVRIRGEISAGRSPSPPE